MKSSTLPERSHNGGVDSFDYHNHRSEYLTGYEAEMAHESKSYVGSNSSFDQEYINPVASPTQQSEIFAFPDNTDTQHERTHTRGYSGSTTHSRGYSGSQGYQEIKIEHPQSPAQANSLSMSVLRPRDTENKYEEGPAPVVPAFANYAPPNDSIPATTPGKQKRHNTIYEESSYEEDFPSQDYLMGNNRSALPSVLRKRNNFENETKEEVQYQPIINESDSTKTYMVILVLLLNVGFLALFAQFLT
uniref:Uncharacterized protein n=1 Tax=Ciona savignyi TaxID=51511 RepID=H2ZL95_CIOSA